MRAGRILRGLGMGLLLAALLPGCRERISGTDAGNANTVAGILRNADGTPSAQSMVYLRTADFAGALPGHPGIPAVGTEWSAKTDARGRYAFRLGNQDTGEFVLEAVTEGFGGRRSVLRREAGEDIDLGILHLEPLGRITGTARLPAGQVGDLVVRLPGTRNAVYLAAGSDTFRFENLPAGDYRVRLTGALASRAPVDSLVTLAAGDSLAVALVAGAPLPDAPGSVTVQLLRPGVSGGNLLARLSGLDTVAVADGAGKVHFPRVAPGIYSLAAWGTSPARDTVRMAGLVVEPGRANDTLRLPLRIRALIVDGIANHDWARMTRYNRTILEETGRFEVAVSTLPPDNSPAPAWDAWQPRFAEHDVVILHCNSGHGDDGKANPWPEARQRELEDFVAGGGGLVNTQATFPGYYGWPAFEAMHGLLWRDKEFLGPSYSLDTLDSLVPNPAALDSPSVERLPAADSGVLIRTVNSGHPVNGGLPMAWRHPRAKMVYRLKGDPAGMTVLAATLDPLTGSREPQVWAKGHGKGRAFTTVLGDLMTGATKAPLQCAGYQTLLIRGAEWAATGQVTSPVPGDFPGPDWETLRDNLKD